MKPEDLQEILLRRIKKVDMTFDDSPEALKAISLAIIALSKIFIESKDETNN